MKKSYSLLSQGKLSLETCRTIAPFAEELAVQKLLRLLMKGALEHVEKESILKKDKRPLSLTLTYCGAYHIKTINRNFRGKDKKTDVLSFPSFESLRRGARPPAYEQELFLGDIIICIPVARSQAKKIGHSVKEEIARLFIHGFFHLMGFDHELSENEEITMRKHERKLASLIKLEI